VEDPVCEICQRQLWCYVGEKRILFGLYPKFSVQLERFGDEDAYDGRVDLCSINCAIEYLKRLAAQHPEWEANSERQTNWWHKDKRQQPTN
jgi:hypothetical protein